MHFIEALFGFSPDQDSGSLELLLVLVPALVVGLVWHSRRSRRSRRE
jgi:hypothetical protein